MSIHRVKTITVDSTLSIGTNFEQLDDLSFLNSLRIFNTREENVQYMAVYPITAYLNHSCDSNVAVVHPQIDHYKGVIALKPIKQGEELFVDYVFGTKATPEEKRDILKSRWGFDCECPKCKPVTASA